MSNKKTNESAEPKQPAYVEELLKNGTAVLTAKTREELADMVNDIPANVRYGAGAAGYNPETGAFTLRVDIIND
jgi:hypothetical protein